MKTVEFFGVEVRKKNGMYCASDLLRGLTKQGYKKITVQKYKDSVGRHFIEFVQKASLDKKCKPVTIDNYTWYSPTVFLGLLLWADRKISNERRKKNG